MDGFEEQQERNRPQLFHRAWKTGETDAGFPRASTGRRRSVASRSLDLSLHYQRTLIDGSPTLAAQSTRPRNRGRFIPLGYLVTAFLGVATGLFLGTNSLVALDLSGVPFLAGTATGLTIGGAETLGYVCLIAATAGISTHQRQTWWRSREKFIRMRSFRDLRLSSGELAVLILGLVLIVAAAFRET